MHPILIDFGTYDLPWLGTTHLFIPTYGVLFALGALAAWWWFMRRARTLGVASESAFNLAFYSLLAGLLGAKLLLIVVEWRYYLANPGEILGSLRSAGVLMGGVLLGAVVFIAYCGRHGLPLFRLGDAIAAPLALAQGIGRLGCFSAGCCYGVPTTSSWCAVTFRDPVARAQTGVDLGVPLVPTQLVQMGADLALAAVLTVLWRRRIRPDGAVFYWFMILYGLSRGVIEFWRGDTVRGLYFGGLLSTSQIMSLAAIVVGAVLLLRGRRAARHASAA